MDPKVSVASPTQRFCRRFEEAQGHFVRQRPRGELGRRFYLADRRQALEYVAAGQRLNPSSDLVSRALECGADATRSPSVVLAILEPDEPAQTVPVDHLAIGCSPRPRLKVVHDPAAFRELGEPAP